MKHQPKAIKIGVWVIVALLAIIALAAMGGCIRAADAKPAPPPVTSTQTSTTTATTTETVTETPQETASQPTTEYNPNVKRPHYPNKLNPCRHTKWC